MGAAGAVSGHAAFAAREVIVRFGGITALESVSLEVESGEVLGIIGPNGAGKTTLFNVICGFVRPQAGTLEWQGRDFSGTRADRLAGLGITRTLQGVGLFPGLNVLENVTVGAQRYRRAGPPARFLRCRAQTATSERCASAGCRNASVIATTELRAIVMTDRDLRRITQEMPSVGAQIAAAIEARS
jgi:ABC-type branched-subunit amino acid transport system ATPase component